MVNKWIQRSQKSTKKNKGKLHQMLGYKKHEKIPTKLLKEIKTTEIGNKVRGIKITPLLKKRSVYAYNNQADKSFALNSL